MSEFTKPGRRPTLVLKLYVVGDSPNSLRARDNLRLICDTQQPDLYQLEIIDILDDPLRAIRDSITVTPTLIKESPRPVQRVVGDLNDHVRLRMLLGLSP